MGLCPIEATILLTPSMSQTPQKVLEFGEPYGFENQVNDGVHSINQAILNLRFHFFSSFTGFWTFLLCYKSLSQIYLTSTNNSGAGVSNLLLQLAPQFKRDATGACGIRWRGRMDALIFLKAIFNNILNINKVALALKSRCKGAVTAKTSPRDNRLKETREARELLWSSGGKGNENFNQ